MLPGRSSRSLLQALPTFAATCAALHQTHFRPVRRFFSPSVLPTTQAHSELVESLSALQLESVVYACQRHEQMLPDGSRGGFFIGGR
jgi:hypothetical protein